MGPDEFKIFIDGKDYVVKPEDLKAETTLNDYLRNVLHLKGTKKMCAEGGCGACLVAVEKSDTINAEETWMAVNSCLVSLMTCRNWNVITVETIGGPLTKYHPAQQVLANFNGTQCGFCSSGMVMNMYALYETGKLTMKEVENSFGGNICRCTGYRSILAAFKSLCQDATPDLLGVYPDIEDLLGCTKSCKENPSCDKAKCLERKLSKWQVKAADGPKWFKVTTLNDLLATIKGLGKSTYQLVAGNTARGVYKQSSLPDNLIDIMSVKELTGYQLDGEKLILGANMSLSDAKELFYKLATDRNSKFWYLKDVADHIDLIANIPVRNIGTLAGNLMTKHTHNEFPSDLFLLFSTVGSNFVIVDLDGSNTTSAADKFTSVDMQRKVLKNIILYSLSKDLYKFRTYKIMSRAQNTHATVNAGFLFKVTNNTVMSAKIIYGNITPDFVHATKTEKFLVGKKLYDNPTLQEAYKMLDQELTPNFILPEPTPQFRKQLAIALFYKAVLSWAQKDMVLPENVSGGDLLERPISTGKQEFGTNESMYPVTKAIPKIEALAQTSGQAQYISDLPDLPNQLLAVFVLAKAAPGSKIKNIDATEALKQQGIVAFMSKDDIIGDNNFYPAALGGKTFEEVFCSETVRYYDQPLGMLVGEERNLTAKAVKLVKVDYIESPAMPLLNARQILSSNAVDKLIKITELQPKKKGTDVTKVIKGKFDLEGQYHFHMETQCCYAVPTEDGLDLHPSTQWIDLTQLAVSQVLKIPSNKINVSVRRCGGGFGGKISRNTHISCATALAAWKLRRPVRMDLTLQENMTICGKRFPLSVDYEVGVNKDGVIQYLESNMYSDIGSIGNESLGAEGLLDMFKSNYGSDSYHVTMWDAKSDTASNTYARAPGTTEALACIESIMEHISYEINADPIAVRLANIPVGSTTSLTSLLGLTNIAEDKGTQLIKYIDDLKSWANIDKRKEDIDMFNQDNRWKKKGIAVVPMAYNFSQFGMTITRVNVYHGDGTVSIQHGGIEIGQGINTKAVQVCAHKLGIPIEKVNIVPSNNHGTPNTVVTGGSMTSEAVCYGILQACDEILEKMKPFKKAEQTWEEWAAACYYSNVNMSAYGVSTATAPNVAPYVIYGAVACEVLVDILTGQHMITRVDLIEDTGQSMSPEIDVGQVEGAFVMGIGYHTTERLVYDQNGQLLTHNTWDYTPPGAKDIPVDFRIKFPENNNNAVGILNSKATGEPPLCMSCSLPLALRYAVSSARSDSDSTASKWYPIDGPSTIENTFMNSLNTYDKYII